MSTFDSGSFLDRFRCLILLTFHLQTQDLGILSETVGIRCTECSLRLLNLSQSFPTPDLLSHTSLSSLLNPNKLNLFSSDFPRIIKGFCFPFDTEDYFTYYFQRDGRTDPTRKVRFSTKGKGRWMGLHQGEVTVICVGSRRIWRSLLRGNLYLEVEESREGNREFRPWCLCLCVQQCYGVAK